VATVIACLYDKDRNKNKSPQNLTDFEKYKLDPLIKGPREAVYADDIRYSRKRGHGLSGMG